MFATIRAKVREDGEYRLGRWGSFWHRFSLAHWRWAVALCKFDDEPRWVLHLFCLWVTLCRARTPPRDDMLDLWGFGYYHDEACLHLNWGHRYKILHMPRAREWVRTEHGMQDGSFVTVEQAGRLPRWLVGRRRSNLYLWPDGKLRRHRRPASQSPREQVECSLLEVPGRYRRNFPYRYVRDNGEVQERTATVTVERRTWTYRLPWLLGVFWPRLVRTSINVDFSDEVGEGTGSWKGGVVGCGSDLLPGETPEACLRRMEAEMRFGR